MTTQESFSALISDVIRKKLYTNGLDFTELRLASSSPEDLIELIYRSWRNGNLRVERNWKGLDADKQNILYSNNTCLLPNDRIFLESEKPRKSWQVATWNVNSIRTRLPLLLEWLSEHDPDVVCLQETKVEDALFPVLELRQAGYESVYYGQKSYNGVAILSKSPIEDVQPGFLSGFDPQNARLLSASISGIRLINVYVPQGQTTESDKFQYKLTFFAELIAQIRQENTADKPLAIMGDFNIAPKAEDLADPEAMLNKVSFHPKEHALLAKLTDIGLSDIFRKFNTRAGQYSWWDFRTRGFERGAGMRIDYILANSVLTSSCQACIIDTGAREQDRPSDHAPVIGEFKL
ncbi:MAG: exodeoxyribonuclease III [SAR324 cluster bacterium]|nr:exodeoxyribonuclease III [SAR324 cluster bacterium]MBL7035961.1 exodeoxyribonuclease III [SAR324 cluster bacterium]